MDTEFKRTELEAFSPSQEKYGLAVIKLMSKLQVWVFQKTGGRLMGTFFGVPIAILTTIGHRSGEERQTPVIYIKEGDTVVIVPSKIGMTKPPAWQYNIEANPNVRIQTGRYAQNATVREANPEEEESLWPRLIKVFPEYEKCIIRTEGIRRIPVYMVEPVENGAFGPDRQWPLEKPSVAVLGGTGALGGGLAYRLAKAGYPVIIGSRNAATAQYAADGIKLKLGKANVEGRDNVSAAEEADLVILTVPYKHHKAMLESVREAVQGKIFIDTTVSLNTKNVDRVQITPEGSAGMMAQEILGDGVYVVSAFQNIAAAHLASDHKIECDVLVTGNDEEAALIVTEMARNISLNAWHAGPIENSVATEALTSLLISLNKRYEIGGAGIVVTGKPSPDRLKSRLRRLRARAERESRVSAVSAATNLMAQES